ncbi:hypothetical protein OG279_26275 [Streptomyces sp. NBC_01201]|uniref:hypothetical protein n=1 Tax=unclassified Streptomyces TaxID=2593676 RepID=UPI002E0EB1A1|nr:hypothetical protein OG725_24525 [Streptomyces sp. NBC_01213]WSQ82794.1 hypothetical protein OG725_37470 [Streptomyces sp. NBC_01213]WSR50927.1 hypothetical protein OG279_26275 [Streptomyces sp. NBC_01201]
MSETTHLKDGDEIRLLGSGGAPVLLTVGRPFSAKDIQRRLGSGEWQHEGTEPRAEKQTQPPDNPGPGPKPKAKEPAKPSEETKPSDPGRPAVNAPKADWVTYVAGLKHMSIEDASAYTKDDLIEMAS